MKKINQLTLFLFLSSLCVNNSNSQVKKIWENADPSVISWQTVTSLGNLIVSKGGYLEGIDTENGKRLWQFSMLKNVPKNTFSEIAGTPYFQIDLKNTVDDDRFLWISQFDGKIVFDSRGKGIQDISNSFLLNESGSLIISGSTKDKKSMVLSIDLATTEINWELNEGFKFIFGIEEVNKEEFILISLTDIYKIKAKSGEIIWKNPIMKESSEQLKKLGGLGALIKKAAENVLENSTDEQNLSFFMHPNKDLFIIAIESKEAKLSRLTSTNTPNEKYVVSYIAFKKSTGENIWSEKERFTGKQKSKVIKTDGTMGNLIFKDNGFIILSENAPKSKANLFDYETGLGKWGKKNRSGGASGIKVKGQIYNYLETDKGILLATQNTSSKNYLSLIDPEDGSLKIKKPTKIKGDITGIVELDNAVLFLTDRSLNILDLSNGKLKWKDGIATYPNLTAEKNDKIYFFDMRSRSVKFLDLTTTNINDFSSESVNFQGSEIPNKLELLTDGILLYSSQNIAKYDFSGKLLFNNYFEAPKERGLIRALSIANGIYASLIAAESYYVSGKLAKISRDEKTSNNGKTLAVQLENAYANYGNSASDAMNRAFNRLKERKKATKATKNFNFILSAEEKEIILLKISRTTGKEEGKIMLGKNREPKYSVDEVANKLYYAKDDTILTGYSLE